MAEQPINKQNHAAFMGRQSSVNASERTTASSQSRFQRSYSSRSDMLDILQHNIHESRDIVEYATVVTDNRNMELLIINSDGIEFLNHHVVKRFDRAQDGLLLMNMLDQVNSKYASNIDFSLSQDCQKFFPDLQRHLKLEILDVKTWLTRLSLAESETLYAYRSNIKLIKPKSNSDSQRVNKLFQDLISIGGYSILNSGDTGLLIVRLIDTRMASSLYFVIRSDARYDQARLTSIVNKALSYYILETRVVATLSDAHASSAITVEELVDIKQYFDRPHNKGLSGYVDRVLKAPHEHHFLPTGVGSATKDIMFDNITANTRSWLQGYITGRDINNITISDDELWDALSVLSWISNHAYHYSVIYQHDGVMSCVNIPDHDVQASYTPEFNSNLRRESSIVINATEVNKKTR